MCPPSTSLSIPVDQPLNQDVLIGVLEDGTKIYSEVTNIQKLPSKRGFEESMAKTFSIKAESSSGSLKTIFTTKISVDYVWNSASDHYLSWVGGSIDNEIVGCRAAWSTRMFIKYDYLAQGLIEAEYNSRYFRVTFMVSYPDDIVGTIPTISSTPVSVPTI